MTGFDQLAIALATALGTDQASAGFIMGLIVIILAIIVVGLAFGTERGAEYPMLASVVGAFFNVLANWWPLWTMVVLTLVVVLLIIDPFKSGEG